MGLVVVRLSDYTVPSVKFGGEGIMVLFFRSCAWPLSPSERNSKCSAYQNILDNFTLPTLWEKFGDGSFLFQHGCARVHKARSLKTSMSKFGVEKLEWPANSTRKNLWDELKLGLQARPPHPRSSKIPIKTC